MPETGGQPPAPATREVEVETKFAVHGLFDLPDLAVGGASRVEARPVLSLRATYVDTPDLRLARDGITLRHRTGDGADRWTLKLPRPEGGGGLSREEVSVAGPGDQVPAELRDLVTAWLRDGDLAPVAVLATERATWLLHPDEGEPLAELVDDTVSLLDGARVVSRFREVELERRSGGPDLLAAVADRLVEAGAVVGEQLPKVTRALGPRAQRPSDLPLPPKVRARGPAGDLVLLALRTGLRRLVGSDVAVRRSESDGVHQMRVACRRLRSDLRTYGPLLNDDRVDRLRRELAWLADALGQARDLEVLRERVRATALRDPLAPLDPAGLATVDELLLQQEEQALPLLLEAVRSPRYLALLDLLVDLARAPVLDPQASASCKQALPALVGRAWRQLARKAGALHLDDPDDDWHEVRILAKRARYAAEAASAALGDARATARAATAVQELLGDHQDAAVAAERLLDLPAERPGDRLLAVTCGRLAERERAAILDDRRAFAGRWRAAGTGRVTRWLTV